MDLDDSWRYLGTFGRYQKISLFLVLVFGSGFPAALTMIMVFITSEPDLYYCTPPDGLYWNETLPGGDGNETDDPRKVTGCQMYEVHDGIVGENLTSCQNGWEYSFTEHGDTSIVSEFDLVCDQSLLKETATMLYMTGLLIGGLPIGQVSDFFGRKTTTFVSIMLMGFSGIGLACAHNYYVFVIMWFSQGFLRQGVMLPSFIWLIEMFPPEKRALVGTYTNVSWGVAVVLLSLLAFLLPNWRHQQLTLSIGILAAMPLWWVVHESVRWLLSQQRHQEAEKIMHKIAQRNSVSPPKVFFKTTEETENSSSTKEPFIDHKSTNGNQMTCSSTTHEENTRTKHDEHIGEERGVQRKLTVIDLFRTPNLAKNTLILTLDWIVASLVYYGLSLNSVNFAGNKYLNFFLISLVEIPAPIVAYVTMEHFGGRRLSVSLSVLVAGIACVMVACMPEITASGTDLSTAITACAMIGKFAISYSWAAIVVYSPEVFPTGVRAVGGGFLTSLSRLGGMVAPFILRLSDISRYLPLNIFGVVSIVAGLLSFLLPETRNVPLPETIEDGEKMTRRRNNQI